MLEDLFFFFSGYDVTPSLHEIIMHFAQKSIKLKPYLIRKGGLLALDTDGCHTQCMYAQIKVFLPVVGVVELLVSEFPLPLVIIICVFVRG